MSACPDQPVGELSGGNQQKVTAARALARKPRLIVAITPTRGVDVASKTLLLAELARVTTQTGAALLLATDELDDLAICDRVIVLVRGEHFTEFAEPPFNREALIAATEGIARDPAGHGSGNGSPGTSAEPASPGPGRSPGLASPGPWRALSQLALGRRALSQLALGRLALSHLPQGRLAQSGLPYRHPTRLRETGAIMSELEGRGEGGMGRRAGPRKRAGVTA